MDKAVVSAFQSFNKIMHVCVCVCVCVVRHNRGEKEPKEDMHFCAIIRVTCKAIASRPVIDPLRSLMTNRCNGNTVGDNTVPIPPPSFHGVLHERPTC
jgi:hypothetical protein